MCSVGRTGNCLQAQSWMSAPDQPRSARLGHRMPRSTRLGLVILGALLAIAGAYTGYWFIVAGQIKDGAAAWAQSVRSDKVDVSWQKLRVVGFPGTFEVKLEAATLRDHA